MIIWCSSIATSCKKHWSQSAIMARCFRLERSFAAQKWSWMASHQSLSTIAIFNAVYYYLVLATCLHLWRLNIYCRKQHWERSMANIYDWQQLRMLLQNNDNTSLEYILLYTFTFNPNHWSLVNECWHSCGSSHLVFWCLRQCQTIKPLKIKPNILFFVDN